MALKTDMAGPDQTQAKAEPRLPSGTPDTLQQAVPALKSATQNLLKALDALQTTGTETGVFSEDDYQALDETRESAMRIVEALKENDAGDPTRLQALMDEEVAGTWFEKTEGTGYTYNYAGGPLSRAIESAGNLVDRIEDDSYMEMNRSLRGAQRDVSAARGEYTSGFSTDYYFEQQPEPARFAPLPVGPAPF